MGSIKEQLAARVDHDSKVVVFKEFSDVKVKIRRMKVKERNEMLATFKMNDPKQADNMGAQKFIVSICCDPPISSEEYDELPAGLVDALMNEIMDFSGWGKKGAAELADQFRPSA